MISASGVEGSLLRHEPSTIWIFSVEGSLLETEPSMKRGISVEGSVLDVERLASIAAMLYRIVGMFAE